MFKLQGKLSNRLHGFLPRKSPQDCLAEYYAATSKNTITALIDPKSAFDITSREVILGRLVDLGINGKLPTWLKGNLSNRTAKVFFGNFLSKTEKETTLETPQGGVLRHIRTDGK